MRSLQLPLLGLLLLSALVTACDGSPVVGRGPDAGDFTILPNYWLMADRQTEFAARVTAKGYVTTTSEPVGGARLGEVITISLQPIGQDKE